VSEPAPELLYKTSTALKRTLRVIYPAGRGHIVLRTQFDWNKNLEPIAISDDGTVSTFEITSRQPFVYFKAGLIQGDKFHWSLGSNNLLLMTEKDQRACYPFFFGSEEGKFSRLVEIPSQLLSRQHRLRVYLPPGYDENTLATYPIAYMQDGQNLFFPEEAFMGNDWQVDQTSQTLRGMRASEDMLIVGLYSGNRMTEYTKPGYELYARSLVEEIIPQEEKILRSVPDRRFRSVWGSSLGGVVSFFTVWEYPQHFGAAVCMSSTFSFKDDLLERVLRETPPDVGFYLDSGWPEDNFEVTMAMAAALVSRGWRYGHNLMHLGFPQARHSERDWGFRLHLPMQFLNGAVARASRLLSPVLSK